MDNEITCRHTYSLMYEADKIFSEKGCMKKADR